MESLRESKLRMATRKGCSAEDMEILSKYPGKCSLRISTKGRNRKSEKCMRCGKIFNNTDVVCFSGFHVLCGKCYDAMYIGD